jgi:hypothetical protein
MERIIGLVGLFTRQQEWKRLKACGSSARYRPASSRFAFQPTLRRYLSSDDEQRSEEVSSLLDKAKPNGAVVATKASSTG